MHTESGERHGHTLRSNTRLVVLLACIGGLAGCATTSQGEAPPATAQTEPEPNPVLEKDQQMVFSRESPAPTPEQTMTPQGAATSPTPGLTPTLEPKKVKAPAPQPTEEQSTEKPACVVDC